MKPTTRMRARDQFTAELFTAKGEMILMNRSDAENLPTGYLHVTNGYARLWRRAGKGCSITSVHRHVLGLCKGDGRIVDHINGDRLDNRMENLRTVSRSVNALNKRTPYASNAVGLLGVTLDKRGGQRPFRAAIQLDGKHVSLGAYATAEEAHAAYMRFKEPLISPEAVIYIAAINATVPE